MSYLLSIHNCLMDLSSPLVMAILNVTTDSFYSHCAELTEEKILSEATRLIEEGADILDIGACSTRPGGIPIPESEEKSRIAMAVHTIRQAYPSFPISVDTFRSSVAQVALQEGADIINDISGGQADNNMWQVIAQAHVPYILTHNKVAQGTSQAIHPSYENLLSELIDYFQRALDQLHRLGIPDVIIDPGFGFAKNMEQNWELLAKMDYLQVLDAPILVGLSRKSMIYQLLDTDSNSALNGTSVANMVALQHGANILRVHDIRQAKETIKIYQQIQQSK